MYSLKNTINKKIFALRKLKYLNNSVKIQFFKSFIMPHFDYCSNLFIFYNKSLLNSLEKFYNISLYSVFNWKLNTKSIIEQKSFLSNFNLLPYKMRIFTRISIFCHKIINKIHLKDIRDKLTFKDPSYFRNRELVVIPDIRSKSGRLCLSFFLPKFLNQILKFSTNLPFNLFKELIYSYLHNDLIEMFLKIFFNYSILDLFIIFNIRIILILNF